MWLMDTLAQSPYLDIGCHQKVQSLAACSCTTLGVALSQSISVCCVKFSLAFITYVITVTAAKIWGGIVLSHFDLYMYYNYILKTLHIGTIIISILHMVKPKHKDIW